MTSEKPSQPQVESQANASKSRAIRPDDPDAVASIEALTEKVRRDGNENLIEVDFRGSTIDDSHLDSLANLPKLRSLLLNGTGVTDEGMKVLGAISTLENLDLRDCGISDAGVASLTSLSKLKAIKFSGKNGATDEHSGCTVSDDGMQSIAQFKNLKVLGVDFLWEVSDIGLAKLKGLDNLEELYAAETTMGDDAIKLLAEFPNLRKLRLARNQITADGIAALPNLKKLEELDLSECSQILDDAMGPLGELTHLKKLNLWRVNLSDEGILPIAKLTSLESLNLDNTRLTDSGMSHLSGLTKLTFLHLGSTQITDDGLPHLEGLTLLKDLVVTRTGVTEIGVASLKKQLPETEIQLKYVGDE